MAQRKKRKKKSSEPTKAQIRQMLGIELPQKPRINRKKLAKEVRERWKANETGVISLAQNFMQVTTLVLGRIEGKTNWKSTLTDSHRVTDEELGILKFVQTVLDVSDREPETFGKLYDIFNRSMGYEEFRCEDGDSDGETKAE